MGETTLEERVKVLEHDLAVWANRSSLAIAVARKNSGEIDAIRKLMRAAEDNLSVLNRASGARFEEDKDG